MRQFDLLIFGATGFAGRYVVERMVQTVHKYGFSTRWAVACRNPNKMRGYLAQMEPATGVADLHNKVPVLQADVTDLSSMRKAFQQSSVVLNCSGPFSLLGEPVVQACIASKSHCMDLAGEPLFLESIQLKYDKAARESEVYVVGSCGFDSVPSDVGTQYLKQNFPGHLSQIEHMLDVWLNPKNSYSFSTWASLIEGFKHIDKLKQVRAQLFSPLGQLYKPYDYRVMQKRRQLRYDKQGFVVPFPGSDRSVVKRTQLHRYMLFNEPPVQFDAYFRLPDWKQFLATALMNYNLSLLTKFDFGEKLLLDYAKFFSLGKFSKGIEPNHETLLDDRFQITLKGRGWPNQIAESDRHAGNMSLSKTLTIRGTNLGYIDTATIAVHTALDLLQQIKKAPVPFGVITPGLIIEPMPLISRLDKEGVLFDFVEEH